MISSQVKNLGAVEFPEFSESHVYMREFNLENPVFPKSALKYIELINKMLLLSPIKSGKSWLTVDSRCIQKGESHRRRGPHVDGRYTLSWGKGGGNGWLNGYGGEVLSDEQQCSEYAHPLGGMLIASDKPGCQYWIGDFDETPGQGGNCLKFNLNKPEIMLDNHVYLANSTCVHESIEQDESVNRQLIRITLPSDCKVF